MCKNLTKTKRCMCVARDLWQTVPNQEKFDSLPKSLQYPPHND